MRFVKGDKKIPFYKEETRSSSSGKNNSNIEQTTAVDTTDKNNIDRDAVDFKPTISSGEKAPARHAKTSGKPGSVTDVITSLRNVPTGHSVAYKSDPQPPNPPIVASSRAEKPVESSDAQLEHKTEKTPPKNVMTYGGNVTSTVSVDEVAKKFKDMTQEVESAKVKRKKVRRIALISVVACLSFLVIFGSLVALFYLPTIDTLAEVDAIPTETVPVFPTGSPVIEYELMANTAVNNSPEINLSLASAGGLLEMRVVDAEGVPITGVEFVLSVIDPDGESTVYTMEDKQGFIELTDLELEGNYVVVLHPSNGYPAVEPKQVEVILEVETKPLDDEELKDKIKDESDIVVSEEDSEFGNDSGPSGATDGSSTPAPTPTVIPVVPDKEIEQVVTPASVSYTSKTTDYKFTITEGEHAGDYIFVVDASGKITGAKKLVVEGSPAPTNVSYGFFSLSDFFLNMNNPVDPNSNNTGTGNSEENGGTPDEGGDSSGSTSDSTDGNTDESNTDSGTDNNGSTSQSESESESQSESESESESEPPPPTEVPVDTNVMFETVNGLLVMKAPFNQYANENKVEEVVKTVYTGWKEIDGKTYYFDANHNKVTGYVSIGGVEYRFNADGSLIENEITNGIDVSKWQGNINWQAVKDSGVEWVIIRAGYRGYSTGVLVEDPYYRQNIEGALAVGLDVGIYIFSQAITVQEAVEEASFCLSLSSGYNLKYGITFDTEYQSGGRANNISKSLRTQIANAFCDTVRQGGRTPMIYASKSWFIYQLDYSAIDHNRIWLAHYTAQTDFAYRYDIWQYTGSGSCAGINGAVDWNYGYLPI